MKTLKSDDTPNTSDLFSDKERSDTVTPVISLKGSVFTLPVIKLSSFDIAAITKGLSGHLANAIEFFRNAPVVIDLSDTHAVPNNEAFAELLRVIKDFDLVCVAVQNGTHAQHKAAIATGLAVLSGQLKVHPKDPQASRQPETRESTDQPVRPAPKAKPPQEPIKTSKAKPELQTEDTPARTTRVIKHPIRSGQRVYAKGGDLILLAAVSTGAEVMADGNIHIYAPLRGRALAGVSGDTTARIFCHSLEAELVAVAGNYRVFENVIPEQIYKQSVQIFLDGEQLKIADIEA